MKENCPAQEQAIFALALDTDARLGELIGLQWKDQNGNKLRIERQLRKERERCPSSFRRSDGRRTIDLSDETVALLQARTREQAEPKMQNRTVYQDTNVVFSQSWGRVPFKACSARRGVEPQLDGETPEGVVQTRRGACADAARVASHVRDADACGRRAAACRAATSRTQVGDHHPFDVRACTSNHGRGRGATARGADSRLT